MYQREAFFWSRFAFLGVLLLFGAWVFSPGLPVMFGPSADEQTRIAGQVLFEHEWQPDDALASGDGLGPVFNATSCAACHFQGGVGGGGGNSRNVNTFLVLPNSREREPVSGTIHTFANEAKYQESAEILRSVFPPVPDGILISSGCNLEFAAFNPVQTDKVNSTALFGAGWIDRISSGAIRYNNRTRLFFCATEELTGSFDSVPTGRVRILADGRIGKFGWKAQFATLEEFVAAACANELGLGTPHMPQPRPLGAKDYPEVESDLTIEQFDQLVAFVDTLERPQQVLPDSATDRDAVARGEMMFDIIGCAACHTPNMDGVEGVYSDFLLHSLTSRSDGGSGYVQHSLAVPVPASLPEPDEWRTPLLWGVADSAPYFHDGGSPTLEHAINRHQGQARNVTKAFNSLPQSDREALVAFLQSLKAPQAPVQVATHQ